MPVFFLEYISPLLVSMFLDLLIFHSGEARVFSQMHIFPLSKQIPFNKKSILLHKNE